MGVLCRLFVSRSQQHARELKTQVFEVLNRAAGAGLEILAYGFSVLTSQPRQIRPSTSAACGTISRISATLGLQMSSSSRARTLAQGSGI